MDRVLFSAGQQCRAQSIFGDNVYLCYSKLSLVTSIWWGLRGQIFLILINLDRWKRHFRKKRYIKNYFYLLKSTKSTKTASQKCWRNIVWADYFGHLYRTNGIKTCLGLPVVNQQKRVGMASTNNWYKMYSDQIYKLS